MSELVISSPAFEAEGRIPNRYSGFGEDVSPEIRIAGMDAEAVSVAIILDDVDHPLFPEYNHWVAWNLPPVDVLPEHLPKGALVDQPFHMEQGVGYGRHCYRGPKPPFNQEHRYRFTVYALDAVLDIDTDADKDAVLKAMEGHVLQTGTLCGRYRKRYA